MNEFLNKCYEYYNKYYEWYNENLVKNHDFIEQNNYYIGNIKKNPYLERIEPIKCISGHFYNLIIDRKEFDNKFRSDFPIFLSFFNYITNENPLVGFEYHKRDIENSESLKKHYNRRPRSFNWFTPSKYLYNFNHDFIFTDDDTKKLQITETGDFCKAYLSIKPENYMNVIIKLQDFINYLYGNYKNEKLTFLKFRFFPSNDAITIRFPSKEQYDEFLLFLDNNKDIMESFDKPNMFMPQDDHGLCVIPDEGNSYNAFVSKIIYEYLDYCKNNNLEVSLDKFVDFVNSFNCDNIIANYSEEIEKKFKMIFIGKITNRPNDELLSTVMDDNSKTK